MQLKYKMNKLCSPHIPAKVHCCAPHISQQKFIVKIGREKILQCDRQHCIAVDRRYNLSQYIWKRSVLHEKIPAYLKIQQQCYCYNACAVSILNNSKDEKLLHDLDAKVSKSIHGVINNRIKMFTW